MSEMLAFCSNKDFFKSPFIQQRREESGVCCCHGDSMAVTPETTFLSTFQTMESVLTAVHTHTFTKCFSQSPTANTMKHCDEQKVHIPPPLFNVGLHKTTHNTAMYVCHQLNSVSEHQTRRHWSQATNGHAEK